jgi:hypothetical protein
VTIYTGHPSLPVFVADYVLIYVTTLVREDATHDYDRKGTVAKKIMSRKRLGARMN